MREVTIRKNHWAKCTLESVTISGSARTLVISDGAFRTVDLSGLRMVDSDLGLPIEVRDLTFPATPESFVVPFEAMRSAENELVGVLSPRALEAYRGMAEASYARYVAIDRSLFAEAPDLPGMNTTPAEVDAILAALWRHHLVRSD